MPRSFPRRAALAGRPIAPYAVATCLFASLGTSGAHAAADGAGTPPRLPAPAPSVAARSTGAAAIVHPLTLLSIDGTRLAFSALGRDWEIALEPRSPLSGTARAELADVALPEFLGGRVVGDERSWVRLARDGERLTGHLFTDGTLYRIEPPTATSATGPEAPDGADGSPEGYRLVRVGAGALPGAPSTRRASDPAPLVSRAIRVGIVVDSLYDAHHDGRGLARALAVMNGVDGLYREQLGLAVLVERVRVLDDPATDPMRTRGGTIEEVLTAFRGVRLGDPNLPGELALVHLFSGHETDDDVIGLGWIDTVCRVDGYDVSVSTPFAFDTLLSAHEIAHNLGALHDEDPFCAADAVRMPGLMEERLSSTTNTDFSDCSLERLRRTLGADCLVDSLDLALDVVLSEGEEPGSRRVSVSVTNTDPFRTARAVRTRTRFPSGARIDETSADCTVVDDFLVCEHGDIAPSATDTASALAVPPVRGDAGLVAVIDPGTFVDSDPTSDRVALDLRAAAADAPDVQAAAQAMRRPPDDAGAAASGTPPGAGGGAGDAAEGGLGRVGAPLLALFALLLRSRRRPPRRPPSRR